MIVAEIIVPHRKDARLENIAAIAGEGKGESDRGIVVRRTLLDLLDVGIETVEVAGLLLFAKRVAECLVNAAKTPERRSVANEIHDTGMLLA